MTTGYDSRLSAISPAFPEAQHKTQHRSAVLHNITTHYHRYNKTSHTTTQHHTSHHTHTTQHQVITLLIHHHLPTPRHPSFTFTSEITTRSSNTPIQHHTIPHNTTYINTIHHSTQHHAINTTQHPTPSHLPVPNPLHPSHPLPGVMARSDTALAATAF